MRLHVAAKCIWWGWIKALSKCPQLASWSRHCNRDHSNARYSIYDPVPCTLHHPLFPFPSLFFCSSTPLKRKILGNYPGQILESCFADMWINTSCSSAAWDFWFYELNIHIVHNWTYFRSICYKLFHAHSAINAVLKTGARSHHTCWTFHRGVDHLRS